MIKRIRQGIIYAFCMTAAAVFLGAAFNVMRPGGIPFIGDWSAEAITVIHAGDLDVVKLDQAIHLYEQGNALFIDAREPGDYANGHIQGSVNIPPEEAEECASEARTMIKTGKTVIAYCYDINCPMGADLVKRLKKMGVGPVKVMPEGWVGWMDAGYPYE